MPSWQFTPNLEVMTSKQGGLERETFQFYGPIVFGVKQAEGN